MVALLVGMAIMAVTLSVALPVWSQMAQREKEEELVFRGEILPPTEYATSDELGDAVEHIWA